MTTYNTGRVLIGSNFQHIQKWEPTRGEELIQTALLNKRTTQPLSLLVRALGAVWRWL